MTKHYLLTVVTRNATGVLSRIAGLLRRKLLNIDSLTVSRTINPDESRFTIVIEGEKQQAHKAAKLIERLIEVRHVAMLEAEKCLQREIVLAQLCLKNEAQTELIAQAKCTVLSQKSTKNKKQLTVELIDAPQKIDDFLQQIQKANIEILDWVRSGVIAMES